ncbi:MAG TPA: FAD-dependent oxidoreductase [Nocardioides sp.]|uniref:NAD(P)/FAD-dependent oxidoreductase n=1 Tax=Nocardioides sp. TaxID=35761 RepID=UPI002E322D7E|nr:FAD-dependent oxidoreductase [Nocardioides sp.]HEX5088646.1 FAD-dependent oxidoreductase [Nocardioides sp.]
MDYQHLSLWHETTPTDWAARPALEGELDADVAIVGAGFTGLWTAYYLTQAEPSLRVVVVEAEVAGFGASGRNGGWCSALFPAALGEAQDAAMRASVDEVRRVSAAEGIDCHFAKGGTIVLARSAAQLARARREYGDAVLSPAEAAQRLRATRTLGATFTPDCAAIHPGRLVRGLADVVVARGVVLHERTPATSIELGLVRTARGAVRAPYVVRATEGFTPRLPRLARAVVPVYSLIIASEPLPPSVWDEIGLAQRETFSDHRHLIIYGQRTADDRLVFGGRGAPYHLGSRIAPAFDRDPRVFAALHATLLDLFPVLAGTRFTHAWGGPLGIPRDWCASVGLDRSTGLAWAGGYVGDGVSTTNLAGRTLADLVLERDSELTGLPWVGHESPRWEPEPLRWLGINAGLRAMTLADAEERLTRRPSVIGKVMAPLVGGHSA